MKITESHDSTWIKEQEWVILNPETAAVSETLHKELLEVSLKEFAPIWRILSGRSW